MSSEFCPHCKKNIKHRKMCPVIRKQKEKELIILSKNKAEEEKIEMERLNNEIASLSINHPRVVEYIKNLEAKNLELERENEMLNDEIRLMRCNPSSYEESYY